MDALNEGFLQNPAESVHDVHMCKCVFHFSHFREPAQDAEGEAVVGGPGRTAVGRVVGRIAASRAHHDHASVAASWRGRTCKHAKP